MDPIEKMAEALRQWGYQTLEEFRVEAQQQFNGTAFSAIRMGNSRVLLAVCITGAHELRKIARAFPPDDRPNADRSKISLPSLAVAALQNSSLIQETFRSEDKELTALALISADPRSISILETIFGLSR